MDRKRQRDETTNEEMSSKSRDQSEVSSARRSISPPSRKRKGSSHVVADISKCNIIDPSFPHDKNQFSSISSPSVDEPSSAFITIRSSPVQLISIKDLPSSYNVDTLSLRDILGEPLIQECWIFNYLFDIEFVMEQFDEDVRDLVKIKIVHGSWKKEDSNRKRIDEAAKRYANVEPITAYMPEAYGTHHSKMIILLRHDGLAQVVILTANMIDRDWRMCQAVWRSPLLPVKTAALTQTTPASETPRIGSGARFKIDLLSYLEKYEKRMKELVIQLQGYDFDSVRAALIASTPIKVNLRTCNMKKDALWGWPALKRILYHIPTKSAEPHTVIQVSSIASVGEKWVSATFLEALSATATPPSSSPKPNPKFSIVFPTGDEIRRSIDGYGAGSSIHMKVQSAAQIKQLTYLKPMLCHWAGDENHQPHQPHEIQAQTQPQSSVISHSASTQAHSLPHQRQAGRRRTAPHIKTYVRFSDPSMRTIDWAMMTSANLSTQAWGAASNNAGEVRVCSYEIGVVVWPGLWDEDNEPGSTEMIPVFKSDVPPPSFPSSFSSSSPSSAEEKSTNNTNTNTNNEKRACSSNPKIKSRIGWRMPYDLPLIPYRSDETPWCASAPCTEPDWMGNVWLGFGAG